MKISNVIFSILLILVLSNASSYVEASQKKVKKESKEKTLSFVLKENNKVQTLKVNHITEYKIRFTLKIDGSCKKTITGIAVGTKGDYENEEDEKGVMYPAIAYEYEGENDYVLSMSIAVETVGYKRDKAIVLEAEDKSGCPVIVKTMNLENTDL